MRCESSLRGPRNCLVTLNMLALHMMGSRPSTLRQVLVHEPSSAPHHNKRAHEQKFAFILRLLLQLEIVYDEKTESVPSCGPDNVQTTIPAEVIVRQRRYGARERRKRVAGLSQDQQLEHFKPAGTLETQGWCLE